MYLAIIVAGTYAGRRTGDYRVAALVPAITMLVISNASLAYIYFRYRRSLAAHTCQSTENWPQIRLSAEVPPELRADVEFRLSAEMARNLLDVDSHSGANRYHKTWCAWIATLESQVASDAERSAAKASVDAILVASELRSPHWVWAKVADLELEKGGDSK